MSEVVPVLSSATAANRARRARLKGDESGLPRDKEKVPTVEELKTQAVRVVDRLIESREDE